MDFRSQSVFQAICYGHHCRIMLDSKQSEQSASLVTISSRMARIQMDDRNALPSAGERATFSPLFLDGVQVNNIPARIDSIKGTEVQISFIEPLQLTGNRLCQITRR